MELYLLFGSATCILAMVLLLREDITVEDMIVLSILWGLLWPITWLFIFPNIIVSLWNRICSG